MIPQYVKPFLWSYDINKIDLKEHRKRIILNVLNLGTEKATKWLFRVYSKKDIQNVIKDSLVTDWDKKSLNLWKMIFGVSPVKKNNRF